MRDPYTILYGPEHINRSAWDDFVMNHPTGNIFQTPQFFELCNSNPGYQGEVICCSVGKEVYGILVAVIQRDFTGLSGSLTARSVVSGGPLVLNNNEEIVSMLLEEYDIRIRKKVLFSQFRNLGDMAFSEPAFRKSGYKFGEHLNFLFSLSDGKDLLWSAMSATRRKQINRSYRREVIASVVEYPDHDIINKCYVLLKMVYKREGLPLPGQNYFLSASKIFGDNKTLKIFIAEYHTMLIGFRMVLCYKGIIYDWYAAASEEHLDKYPNDLLPWEIMKWGAENNYKSFDFGGAGQPGKPYGVRDYKLKFGGGLVNFGRYTRVHKRIMYRLVMAAFNMRKKLLKRR